MSKAPAEHGTTSGYLAHRRIPEEACEPCKKAMADYNRIRRSGNPPGHLSKPTINSKPDYMKTPIEDHEDSIADLEASIEDINETLKVCEPKDKSALYRTKLAYRTELTNRKNAVRELLTANTEPEKKEGEDDSNRKPRVEFTLTRK